MSTLETLRFDNLALRTLPLDKETRNYVRTVSGAVFSRVLPAPVESPEMVVFSEDAMMLLDLPPSELQRKDAPEYFSGNKLLPGSETAAHCYCGHQFGYFAGQLGDGAAMYLGEVINRKGERWEIQLKGAGLTPYSRVLNTDNMSILGLTIDYGPFGFMERFDPDHICNTSDDGGRYTYIKQPEICLWNLRKFAEAIQSAVPLSKTVPCLDLYASEYEACFLGGIRRKLGLLKKELAEDKDLVTSFYDTMERTGADFTRSFRCLSTLAVPGHPDHEPSKESLLSKLLSCCSSHAELTDHLKSQTSSRDFQLFLILSKNNPELLEQLGKGALAKERIMAQIEKAKELKEMSAEDFEARNKKMWTDWIEAYCKRLTTDVEGVKDLQALQDERVHVMNNNNPRFVLRNYIAQQAIDAAEKGDYNEARKVLKILQRPFSDDPLELKAEGRRRRGISSRSGKQRAWSEHLSQKHRTASPSGRAGGAACADGGLAPSEEATAAVVAPTSWQR
ncbi:hypothetical protein HPB52_014047 [Rhipicephalus sanguineus]|uniref:Selenoprotein O n=1 Tax=Rhipicephalus sanguineus TaxID=34632 RepID=A0A9D4SWE7_RHISA|nr:hypothetical protein HPB52_014047 [Rhipicephalus sanguineus]